MFQHPHRRLNPLTGEWLLVSPHRAERPWQGQTEKVPPEERPQYDPDCYLCPGNSRAGGAVNPKYTSTYVFDNDFPALLTKKYRPSGLTHALFQARPERGICRVLCFSPRHDLTLALMSVKEIRPVVDMWAEQTEDFRENVPWIQYVQIFENRGAMMGASNPHPHGQIWATEFLTEQVKKEDRAQRNYYYEHGQTMLAEVLVEENRQQQRIIYANDHWTVIVPFWAVWPFETLLIANRPVQFVDELDDDERDGFADALSATTIRYDNLFETSFPYSMGIHQAPLNDDDQRHWHLHVHFYPPLLRSATVKKHMVGFEMLGMPQRDITPEGAAEQLRNVPAIHYTKR